MREIKFKVWLPNIKKMTYEHTLEELTKGNLWNTDGETNCSIIWLQYTGLKDKNGKEIYEGDILKDCDTREIKTVIWHKNCFILRDTKGFYQWTYFENEHEVIGNIYENPELLEV